MFDDDSHATYRITRKGYDTIWSWIRFKAQECELIHPMGLEDPDCGDEHRVVMMLPLLLPTPERAEEMGMFDYGAS